MVAGSSSGVLPPARPASLRGTGRAGVATRRTLLVALWAFGLAWMGGTIASTAGCYAIADRDARAYCLAGVSRSTGRCYSVREHDKRKLCLATLKGQRSYCHAIKGGDTRRQCLTVVK